MRLRPTLLALAITLAAGASAAGTSAAAQTAAPAATKPAAGARPATAATASAATAKSDPIDINTASKADLQGIPGIGDVYAAKIIANRPYHSKDELTRKKVLPAGIYAKVKDRIIARQH